MNEIFTETKIKVPFFDLDPMNIVWHGNYIKYIEQARCDFFEKINYNYTQMYSDGIMYPIAKMDLKYIKSAKFGENLRIICTLKELEPAIIFKYNIFCGETKLLTASTMQIGVFTKTGETFYEAPEKLKEAVKNFNW